MSGPSKTDMVMMFIDGNGGPVWAESTLAVNAADPLMKGFTGIESYADYSNFFEITNFSFDVKIKAGDKGVSGKSQSASSGGGAPAAQDEFSSWRSAGRDEYKRITFPLEFDTFSFSRFIDSASPIFFSACCNQNSFKQAALVKRVSVGQSVEGQSASVGFLRLDFWDVLLTSVNWEDGDLVTESCTFICKAMKARYAPQKFDGTVLASVEANWDQQKDGSASGGGGS